MQAHRDILQRSTGKLVAQQVAPGAHLETTIGGLQRRNLDLPCLQPRQPGPVRPQPRPTGSAQRQQCGCRFDRPFTVSVRDAQAAISVPARPAMPRMNRDTGITQPLEPGTEQGRGFHVCGKHTPRAADESLDAQRMNPLAQGISVKTAQQRCDHRRAFGIARQKGRVGLGVGDVHTAHPGEQELAPDRRHGVVQIDLQSGLAQHFCCHQPRRAASDDGDGSGSGEGKVGHGQRSIDSRGVGHSTRAFFQGVAHVIGGD